MTTLRFFPHDDTVLQDNAAENAYTELGHRSAVLLPPVYESLGDYEFVPDVSNSQRNSVEEHQMTVVQKNANAEQGLAKAL